jgi:pimeloyl-ACP methyl ester carboxylesterase
MVMNKLGNGSTPVALELAFEESGSGPPVLVLHGLFGSATNWRSVARALAKSRRVLAVDLRNHGLSPWADSMGYSDMADDVLALIEGKGLQQPAVIGHSMGGKVAMVLALRHPGSVGQLVVVDIAPVRYEDRFTEYVLAMRNVDFASHRPDRLRIRRRYRNGVGDRKAAAV